MTDLTHVPLIKVDVGLPAGAGRGQCGGAERSGRGLVREDSGFLPPGQ